MHVHYFGNIPATQILIEAHGPKKRKLQVCGSRNVPGIDVTVEQRVLKNEPETLNTRNIPTAQVLVEYSCLLVKTFEIPKK